MLLHSAVSIVLSLGLAVKALPVANMGVVDLARRMHNQNSPPAPASAHHSGSGSSIEVIDTPSPPSSETRDICTITIRGHLAKGGSQQQAWVVTSAPGFEKGKYFAKTSLTASEFDATYKMKLVIAHNKEKTCAMMPFLGHDITSLPSYHKAYQTSEAACDEWVEEKFKLVEVQIDAMRVLLGDSARHRDLHPWNTRWMSETELKIIDFGMLHKNGGEDVDKAKKAEWKKMLCKSAGPGAKINTSVLHSSGGISDGDFVHVKLSDDSFEVVQRGSGSQ
ncbi:hypothetical protein FRB91_006119 [Serendipita sp. 411]|nr:hypothetical protein FRC19_007505 [Serendipita sp. 401]KAG8852712.1 hypothetical protein FRB91_006119 [Serendipita sp. 411]